MTIDEPGRYSRASGSFEGAAHLGFLSRFSSFSSSTWIDNVDLESRDGEPRLKKGLLFLMLSISNRAIVVFHYYVCTPSSAAQLRSSGQASHMDKKGRCAGRRRDSGHRPTLVIPISPPYKGFRFKWLPRSSVQAGRMVQSGKAPNVKPKLDDISWIM